MRQLLRVDQSHDRLVEGDTRGDEDDEDNDKSGELLNAEGAQEEGYPERHRRQGIAEVVDQVGEERNRAGEHEDHRLHDRRNSEHAE